MFKNIDEENTISSLKAIEQNLIRITLKSADIKVKEMALDSLNKIISVIKNLNEWSENESKRID